MNQSGKIKSKGILGLAAFILVILGIRYMLTIQPLKAPEPVKVEQGSSK